MIRLIKKKLNQIHLDQVNRKLEVFLMNVKH